MTIAALKSLETLFLRDDEQLDPTEAQRLADASRDGGDVDVAERTELQRLASDRATSPAVKNVLEKFLSSPVEELPMRAMTGGAPSSFEDDVVVLAHDGSFSGTSGVTPYVRSYDAVHTGPMRERHGSLAPKSTVLSADELERQRAQTPGQALDAAAKERGFSLRDGFEALANAKSSFDPEAPTWWGKCHAWAWSALSNELSARVDVGGAEGARGLWFGGQWISRADLGNFLMGTADSIALGDKNVLFDAPVSAVDLLQATSQFLVNGGGGFAADIHNDAVHGGDREVWNQPFFAADVDVATVNGEGAAAVLELAKKDGVGDGVAVKHVHVVGRYGNERSDAYEGPAASESRRWNVYAVVDAGGVVRAAYLADDARLEGARGLPTRASDELPEYVWKPTLRSADAALEGTPETNVDTEPLSREFRFLAGEVLKKGIPGAMRERFEREVAAQPQGALSEEVKAGLRARYPGIEAAYSKAQWAQSFASRGL